MTIYNKSKIAFVIALIFSLGSCNLDPDKENDETPPTYAELLVTLSTQVAFNQMAIPGRTANVYMQYLDEADFSATPLSSYSLQESYFDNYWNNGLYRGSLKNGKDLLDKSLLEGNQNMEAIARILMAHEYGTATSLFGDIPYEEALLGVDNQQPKYDSQESVYQAILDELDLAIAIIKDETLPTNITDADYFCKGDMSNWKKLAYALKARYSLHLTKRDPAKYNELEDLVSNSFTSYDDQASFDWNVQPLVGNPLYTFSVERPSTLFGGDQLKEDLENSGDPRRSLFFTDYGDFQNFNLLFWGAQTATIPLVSYTEMQFIRAEAMLMSGADNGSIEVVLEDAVSSSFDQMDSNSDFYQSFILDLISMDGLTSNEGKLQHIMGLAYTSYYPYASISTMNNYHRVGYPELALTGSNSESNPSGVLPERYLYPDNELNEMNLQAAKDNQSGALLDVPLWIYE